MQFKNWELLLKIIIWKKDGGYYPARTATTEVTAGNAVVRNKNSWKRLHHTLLVETATAQAHMEKYELNRYVFFNTSRRQLL